MKANQKGFAPLFVIIAILAVLGAVFFGIKYLKPSLPNISISEMGWVYKGVFPTSATNFTALKLPDNKFVAYYNSINPAALGLSQKEPFLMMALTGPQILHGPARIFVKCLMGNPLYLTRNF